MRNRVARTLIPFILGALAVSSGHAFAQEETGQQQARQLSEKAQKATARLHALAQARAAFASAAAQRVQEPEAKEFLQGRAQDYMKLDEQVVSFAESYNVDLGSEEMQKEVEKHQRDWIQRIDDIQKAERPEAATMALETFIERNEGAVKDLKDLRKEVENEEVSDRINEMISSLEEETTRAKNLHKQMKTAMKEKEQG